MPLDTKPEYGSVAATDSSPNRRRPSGPKLIALAIAATAVGSAIYSDILSRVDAEASLARTTSEAAVPSVTIIHPSAGAPQNEIALPGYTQPFTDTPIYARTSGYLKAWHFVIGAHVRKATCSPRSTRPKSTSSSIRPRPISSTPSGGTIWSQGIQSRTRLGLGW
jgi:hypothetical protein